VIHLPEIDIADNYPILGPNGKEYMNINGIVCEIEMFLGKDVLIYRKTRSCRKWLLKKNYGNSQTR